MKTLVLLFGLMTIANMTFAQRQHYQIELDGHRAGSFLQKIEVDNQTHTFSELDLQIKTLQNTIHYHQRAHFIESDSGFLQSVQWSNTIIDTIAFKLSFTKESPLLLGPEKIKSLSSNLLDSIGAKFCYQTFVIALNKPTEVHRELMGYSIENAQKLWIVKESIDSSHVVWLKFDQSFNTVEMSRTSPFGKIKLRKVDQTQTPQFIESNINSRNNINSNILFPDPNQIQSIQVKLTLPENTVLDILNQGNQEIINVDDHNCTIISTNDPTACEPSLSAYAFPSESLISRLKAEKIIDSLFNGIADEKLKVKQLVNHAITQDPYTTLYLYQLALTAQLPARIVYGYSYDRWFWKPGYWIEIASEGFWKTYDLTTSIQSNAALKIALVKSLPGEGLNSFYLSDFPLAENLQVESFVLRDNRYAVSNQVLPYYFENPVYENEGLGIRFNIPGAFGIANDGTRKPSANFLTLDNRYSESIVFSQVIIDHVSRTKQESKKSIGHYLSNSHIEINYDKKLNLWHAFHKQRGAIAIAQGSSIIFIAIESKDPEAIIDLLITKNLHLKY